MEGELGLRSASSPLFAALGPLALVASAVLLLLSSVAVTPVTAFEGEYILLDDENIYPMLLRLRALGAPVHENLSVLPITRGQAANVVRATRSALNDGTLTLPGSAREQLRFLERELAPELGEDPPGRYHELRWDAHDARVRYGATGRLSVTAVPDPEFVPDAMGNGTQSPDTEWSAVIEPRPEATLALGDRLIVQERLNMFYLVGDGVRAAELDVSQGEAIISEGDDDSFLYRRSFDTVGRLLLGDVAVETGRMRMRWGHGRRGTLLLSDYTPPMDFIRIVGAVGRFRFANVAAELRTNAGQRYLASHRLSYNTPALTVSMSESVIFGNRAFDLAYVNPFQLFLAVEDNIGARDNNILGADVRWRPTGGIELWTEAILDDWNLRHGLDFYANKIALQVGGVLAGLPGLPGADLEIEYSLVDQFTYTHVDSINRATHYDGVVGHRIGTDAELLSVTLAHWFGAGLQAFGRYERERQGEGDVSIDHRAREDDRHHFLTGTLETSHNAALGLRYRRVRGFEAHADVRRAWIRSFANDSGSPDVTETEMSVGVKVEL